MLLLLLYKAKYECLEIFFYLEILVKNTKCENVR